MPHPDDRIELEKQLRQLFPIPLVRGAVEELLSDPPPEYAHESPADRVRHIKQLFLLDDWERTNVDAFCWWLEGQS